MVALTQTQLGWGEQKGEAGPQVTVRSRPAAWRLTNTRFGRHHRRARGRHEVSLAGSGSPHRLPESSRQGRRSSRTGSSASCVRGAVPPAQPTPGRGTPTIVPSRRVDSGVPNGYTAALRCLRFL